MVSNFLLALPKYIYLIFPHHIAGTSLFKRQFSTSPDVLKAAGLDARVCAILGSQWGDEGKGKLADVLAAK